MEIREAFRKNGFIIGRMISGSKSAYRYDNPNSITYFNANIFTLQDGKVWWGDLDLTKDADALKAIASDLGKTLFILSEYDGRFEKEEKPIEDILKDAVWDTTKETPFK